MKKLITLTAIACTAILTGCLGSESSDSASTKVSCTMTDEDMGQMCVQSESATAPADWETLCATADTTVDEYDSSVTVTPAGTAGTGCAGAQKLICPGVMMDMDDADTDTTKVPVDMLFYTQTAVDQLNAAATMMGAFTGTTMTACDLFSMPEETAAE